MKPKVLMAMATETGLRPILQDRLAAKTEITFLEDVAPGDRAAIIKSADVLIFFRLTKELQLQELPLLENLSLLQSVPAGVETLPYADLPAKMIICANAGAWSRPLAEYIIGLMIALDRELVRHRRKLAGGEFERGKSRYLFGKIMGIVGFGGIGRAAARLASGLGLRIMALNQRGRTEDQVDFIGTLADLDHVLRLADVVLLATPLTKRTHGLIGARELSLMKSDAILINVGRGPLIDEDALYEHLRTHPDYKFGADVWWDEPIGQGPLNLKHPLFDFPNVLGTPHNADFVDGMLADAFRDAVDNVADFIDGRPLRGVVDRNDYL